MDRFTGGCLCGEVRIVASERPEKGKGKKSKGPPPGTAPLRQA